MGACRNSFFGVFGIFLAKKSSPSSKFQRGNIFTWPTFSHFVMGGYQNSLKLFRPDLDRNKLGLNLV